LKNVILKNSGPGQWGHEGRMTWQSFFLFPVQENSTLTLVPV